MANPTLLPILAAGLVLGVADPTAAAETTSPLIEELREIVEKSRRERAADRWLQDALEDLLAKHDSPWQRELLYEDFHDGDYTRNPSWQVLRGEFQVLRGQGLYSAALHQGYAAEPASKSTSDAEALGGLIVGALLDQALGTSRSQSTSGDGGTARAAGPAEIRLKADIGNAFAIDLAFRQRDTGDGAFEIALLQSEAGRYGYRLRVQSGQRGFIELQRIRGGRGVVVEHQPLNNAYADGKLHELTLSESSISG